MLPLTRSSEGLRLLSAGQLNEAVQAFEFALQQDPKDVRCLLGLARAQIALGNPQAALGTFQKIFAIRPDHLEAKSHLGALLAKVGDPKGAKALEEAAKDRRSGYIEHLNYGLYLAGKDDEKAQKEFEAAVRTEGREAVPYVELGKISERRKDLRAALRHYMKAGEVALPHDSMPFVLRARVHRELDEKPAAVAAMMEGLLRFHKPGESDGKLPDGKTYEQLFEEAFALCMDAQQFDSAVKVAMQALEHTPENVTAQTWLHEASVASRQAAPNKRRSSTTSFEATDASMVDPEANLKKAEELLFRKPPAITECLAMIEPVIRAKPNDQKALICKAIALAVKGDKAGALPLAQRAATGENKFVIAEANALIKALTGKK